MRPGSKNRRRNTGIVVQREQTDGPPVNILIDAGKFFYQAAIEWFPKHAIRTIDAVVLTHAHADSAGGLDDLRDWTNMMRFASGDEHAALLARGRHARIPIFLRNQDLEIVSKTAYYLVDRTQMTSGGTVAILDFQTVDERANRHLRHVGNSAASAARSRLFLQRIQDRRFRLYLRRFGGT